MLYLYFENRLKGSTYSSFTIKHQNQIFKEISKNGKKY